MKLIFLTYSITAFSCLSVAQNNFVNLWKLQDSENKVEIKINKSNGQKGLPFVVEGLSKTNSRTYISGTLDHTGLNEFAYKDPNSTCNLTFHFINQDSAYVSTKNCENYTLQDSLDGLYTTNETSFLSYKMLKGYDYDFEQELALRTGDFYQKIKTLSIEKRRIDLEEGQVFFFHSTKDSLALDPKIVFYLTADKYSVFYRENDKITSFTDRNHKTLPTEILLWIQKNRISPETEQ
ncbi:MAG: hypothetical protein ACPG6V_08110 [Flavobacteriales bacterium]